MQTHTILYHLYVEGMENSLLMKYTLFFRTFHLREHFNFDQIWC